MDRRREHVHLLRFACADRRPVARLARDQESFFNVAEFKASFPLILRKFVRNIFIFCVAEVLVLILALFIAVLRSLPGPVFTPLRILAAGYTDLFRGVPTILVIILLGYGMPALNLARDPRLRLRLGHLGA